MEALVALGFACNVIQLAQAGCEVATIFRQAYKDGTTKHESDLRSATQSLSICLSQFKQTPSLQLQDEEKELLSLGCKVASIAESLHDTVKDSTANHPSSTYRKLRIGWRSIRHADAIKEKEAKLRLYQETLNTTILVDLRKRFLLVDVQHRQDFNQLSDVLQNFLKDQAVLQHREHQETRAVIQHESVNTREDLGAQLNALAIKNETETVRQQFLSSLRSPDMNKRKTDITRSFDGTFEWMLNGADSDMDDEAGSDGDDSNEDDNDDDNDDSNDKGDKYGDDGDDDDRYKDFWNRQMRLIDRDDLRNSDFVEWLVGDDNNYWVCGKAGSGKSTLMRFVIEHDSTRMHLKRWAGTRELDIIEAYIWNAGSDFQKSYKGVLATILFQLLELADTNTLDLLVRNQRHRKRLSITDWYPKEIEDLIFTLIRSSSHCFCLFIDGLDELEIQQRLEDDEILLRFVDRVSQLPNVKCCLSSRPERLFEMFFQHTQQLRLEKLNVGDIGRLCVETLKQTIRETHRPFSENDVDHLQLLVKDLVERASGIFLWAHLVLAQIRRGIRAHDGIAELRNYLDSLPSEITRLYEDMWARNNEDLPQHREEAGGFINLALLVHGKVICFPSLRALNVVQFALMFDQKLRRDPSGSLRSDDTLNVCMRFKDRIPVRSAGLLHVVEGDGFEGWPTKESSFITSFESLRELRVEFIHRTAKNFLLTESMGHKIRSEASISMEVMLKRFLHTLLLEQSLSNQRTSYGWLHDFALSLRTCDHLLHPHDIIEILQKLEEACKGDYLQHSRRESLDGVFRSRIMSASGVGFAIAPRLLPGDLDVWIFTFGSSPRLLSLIECTPNRLNPEYCAYLLCIFCCCYPHVDQNFHKLFSILLRQLQPATSKTMYAQCTIYDSSYGVNSGVRRSIGDGLVSLMFEHGRPRTDSEHDRQVSLLVMSYLSQPDLPNIAFSVLIIDSDFQLRNEWPRDEHIGDFGFLIEYDLKEVLRRCCLTASATDSAQNDRLEGTLAPPDHEWSITTKAIGFKPRDSEFGWCEPCVEDCDTVSRILSRLPVPPCHFGLPHRYPQTIDPEDAYWKSLLALAHAVWKRSPTQDWLSILSALEFIVPADDPRVLKRAPPMFLDEPAGGGGEDSGCDEEDEFFDAAE